MSRELKNTPNIVVDDNYRMLVNRLTRRYAERGASVYTDAEAIEQERSDARARAIAPDAYRLSRTLSDNAEQYKSEAANGARYMTTDDYLVYFSKCHDAFDAVNYYDLHKTATAEELEEAGKPRVLVNRKRLEMALGAAEPEKKTRVRTKEEQSTKVARKPEKKTAEILSFPAEESEFSSRMRVIRRRATKVLATMSACLALLIGGMLAFAPASAPEINAREMPEVSVMELAEQEAQVNLYNQE